MKLFSDDPEMLDKDLMYIVIALITKLCVAIRTKTKNFRDRVGSFC